VPGLLKPCSGLLKPSILPVVSLLQLAVVAAMVHQKTIDVMGFNYLTQCNIDDYHMKFPDQAGWGTEETTGCGTRGIYEDDKSNGHLAQYDRTGGASIETGWKFYDERPWLSGVFFWTGFDYKGEPNPLSWPAVSSEYRHPRCLRISQGCLFLPQIMVDQRTGSSYCTALELERKRRTGNQRMGIQQLRPGGTFSK